MADNTEEVGVWYNILGAALQIPGAKVDRKEFLVFDYICTFQRKKWTKMYK